MTTSDTESYADIGQRIHALAQRLWGINRSITGDGVRQTLAILRELLPELRLHEVPSGTAAFDWTVPREWRARDAYIVAPDGRRICEFSKNNLHLVGYSTPVRLRMRLAELQAHLYSLPEQPDAIPYITSYYKERWGFCLSQQQRDELVDGDYEVVVDTELFDGSLSYGELVVMGSSTQEVLVSTYLCHPSMANNELSGPTVTAHVARWVAALPKRRYTYRFVFIPETIGSLTYISRNLDHLKSHVCAGFNVTCVGDDRAYSYLPSRHGNTISDSVARHVLKHIDPHYKAYHWNDRGSDERQYCAPGIDLPVASIMRTKYGEYPEYHTSLDDLIHVVTPAGLAGGFNALTCALESLERNLYPLVTVLGEPQLGKRGLYPTLSTKSSGAEVRLMMNLITWSDGSRSLLEIAELCEAPVWALYDIVDRLAEHGLLSLSEAPQP
jgi:aminopeptidase-like protein